LGSASINAGGSMPVCSCTVDSSGCSILYAPATCCIAPSAPAPTSPPAPAPSAPVEMLILGLHASLSLSNTLTSASTLACSLIPMASWRTRNTLGDVRVHLGRLLQRGPLALFGADGAHHPRLGDDVDLGLVDGALLRLLPEVREVLLAGHVDELLYVGVVDVEAEGFWDSFLKKFRCSLNWTKFGNFRKFGQVSRPVKQTKFE